jgi:hypothetical protein
VSCSGGIKDEAAACNARDTHSFRHGRAFDPAIHFAAHVTFDDLPNISTGWMAGSKPGHNE